MSKIDNIFKDGLGKSGMEYQPAYWEQMEGLLGAQKVGFWAKYKWYFGILALLLISGSAVFYTTTIQNSTPNTEAVEVAEESTAEGRSIVSEVKNELPTESAGTSKCGSSHGKYYCIR